MEESDKLSLKRVELSLSKFNEVAIPHHLDLLRQHKANIIKYTSIGDSRAVRAEQAHARRAVSRLRALLADMDALRRRLSDDDRPRFDHQTRRAREHTLAAIMDYLESEAPAPVVPDGSEEAGSGSDSSESSVGVEQAQAARDQQLRDREEALRGWSALQHDVAALHDTWRHLHTAAQLHADQVQAAAGAVEVAAVNVAEGRAAVWGAARLRAGAGAAAGAALGAAAAGPLGLLLGAKAGAAAALAGSLLGYWGARTVITRTADPPADTPHHKDQ